MSEQNADNGIKQQKAKTETQDMTERNAEEDKKN